MIIFAEKASVDLLKTMYEKVMLSSSAIKKIESNSLLMDRLKKEYFNFDKQTSK